MCGLEKVNASPELNVNRTWVYLIPQGQGGIKGASQYI
jgi:hypothetical protein